MKEHEHYMSLALQEAHKAALCGEVPIGAIVVSSCGQMTYGYNQPIKTSDPSAHAEVIALRKMALLLGNYRLPNCSLYVTLQPCLMCLGLINHCRLEKIYFGSIEKKYRIDYPAHTTIPFIGPILETECTHMLTHFFTQKRTKS